MIAILHSRALLSVLTALLLALGMGPAAAEGDIGKTVAIKNEVTATLSDSPRKLAKGDVIHQNELISTTAESEGEFVLADDTKLAVGPNSKLALDAFIYDPAKKSGGQVVINASQGAFRFISGKSQKSAYQIKTPVASIGVRGTIFDGYVNDDGEIALLLVQGEVDVCGQPGSCRRLRQIGSFFHIRQGGIISGPLKWDGTFLPAVAFGSAFPFIDRSLTIDPVRRFRRADLLGGRLLPQRVVPVRPLQRVVPRLPRPF
ncbi:MAG: FecR domain-containing protein [Pseudomonadota bacterium]|nr:FecR domain-containing protein [Pseudomonadota bacterium]